MSENSTRAQIASAISEAAEHGTAFARSMLGLGLGVLIVGFTAYVLWTKARAGRP